jgi:uncharacterized protein (DUF58 family)
MLQTRGQLLLAIGLSLVAGGVLLPLAGLTLAGVLLLVALLVEVERLRQALRPGSPPLGVVAELTVLRAADEDGTGRSHRLGRMVPLQLVLRLPQAEAGAQLAIGSWWSSAGLALSGSALRTVTLARHSILQLGATGEQAAIHRLYGLRGQLSDRLGLVAADVFLPAPCELAVLPRLLTVDLRKLAETRRMSPRSAGSQRPDRVPGTGDDLRELREHQPGDPFKHIAWKASAARGRLMSRSFEREQTRALYLVVETGATLRDGRPGHGALDQAMDLVHSLADAAARAHDPFGLSLVDGRVIEQRPVLEGMAALHMADRALLDLRRAVAEDLAPLAEDELVQRVAGYLHAIERVPLLPWPTDPLAQQRQRQRVVMAALARLPERERRPEQRGPEPASRPDLAILRRFCRAVDLGLPYRGPLSGAERVAGLVAGVRAAMAARKGPFFLIIASDFRRMSGTLQPLLEACAAARKAGHRVVVVALRESDGLDVLDVVRQLDDVDTARGLARADEAARQVLLDELAYGCRKAGAGFLADPDPQSLAAIWRASV